MNKIRLLLAGSISLILLGCAADKNRTGETSDPRGGSADFRHAAWGMNKEEVKAAELSVMAVPDPSGDKLVYEGNLFGRLKTRIVYHFKGGRLIRGTYNFTPPLTLLEFKVLGRVLAEKYGKPHSLSTDSNLREIEWLTPKTEIDLLGRGPDFEAMDTDEPHSVKAVKLTAIEINYYDNAWYAGDLKKYERAESEIEETDMLYHRLVGAWVELPWYSEWESDWGSLWDEGWGRDYYYDL